MNHPSLPNPVIVTRLSPTESARLTASLSAQPPVKTSPFSRLAAPLLAAGRKPCARLLALALPALATPASAQFLHTDAGPYDYNTTTNWNGGTINNQLTASLAADQTITFAADTVLSGGLTINNTGAFGHTFAGAGADRTLTLGGNISLGGSATNANTVTLGGGAAGSRLNLDLGGSSRLIAVGANRTLEIRDVFSGTGGFTKQGAGTLKLVNTANTFTGGISIGGGSPSQFGGVLEVSKLANSGQASSIGAGSGITFGGANGAATLRYVGSGDGSNRTFTIGSQGAIFDSSGSGAIQFTATGNIDVSPSSTVSRTLAFTGANTGANSFASVIRDPSVSAQTSVLKSGAGRWILSGANTYPGATTIDAGTLELGAANRVADVSALVLNGGTFATGGFSETFATLDLNGNAVIDFGSGDSDLVFADSSAVAWGSSISLSVINFTEGVDTLRIGATHLGLAIDQLGKITINGFAAEIDAQGYLSPSAIPETSAAALLSGLGGLGVAALRRRRPRS